MKEVIEKRTIILFIAVIFIIGIIMYITNGFNIKIEDSNSKRISVHLYQEFEKEDVKNIIKEVLQEDVEIRYVGYFKDAFSFTVKDINDEQTEKLKEKLSEKYTWDEGTQSITVNDNLSFNLIDEAKKYISPVIISFIIISVYLLIRYKNVKSILSLIIKIIVSELFALSIVVIARIPLNEDILSISIFAYILAIIIETVNAKKIIEEE